MSKVYYLDYINDSIEEYDSLDELLYCVIDNEDIINMLNDTCEIIDTPVGPKYMGDIVAAFDEVDSLRDGEVDWWRDEIEYSLKTDSYYTFNNGEISYDKNLLKKLKEGLAC